jgi:hypothetical protein
MTHKLEKSKEISSVMEPEPRAEEPKLNCLPEPEITNSSSGSFLFTKDLKIF